MAELLLDEKTRVKLAKVLEGKICPLEVDHAVYCDIQRGVRSAISFHSLAAIAHAHGDIVTRAVPGLKG